MKTKSYIYSCYEKKIYPVFREEKVKSSLIEITKLGKKPIKLRGEMWESQME